MLKRLVPFFLMLCLVFPSYGKEPTSVLFLVDLSGSMERNDPQKLVLEALLEMVSLCPEDYALALVTYESQVVTAIPFTTATKLWSYLSEEPLVYGGYSNAGAGLDKAMTLLEDREGETHIVLICDGEILLPSADATAESERLFQNAIENGTDHQLHILALGTWAEDSFLLQESQRLSGVYVPVEGDIQESILDFVISALSVPLTLSHSLEIVSSSQRISWKNPWQQASQLSLTLHSSQEILGFTSSYPVEMTSGFSRQIVFQEDMPETFDFLLETKGNSQLSLYYQGKLQLSPQIFLHTVEGEEGQVLGEISFLCADGSVFWEEETPLPLEIQGETGEFALVNGRVFHSFSLLEEKEFFFSFPTVPLDCVVEPLLLSALPVVETETPPVEETKSVVALWFLLGYFGGVLCYKGYYAKKKHPSTGGKTGNKKQKKSRNLALTKGKYPYVGQLTLELIQGRESFPQARYPLFRVPQHRPISLGEILAVCYDISGLCDVDDLVFSAGKNKALCLYHGANSTLLYEHIILRKHQQHAFPIGAEFSLRLSEGSEVVIRYDLN